MIDRQSALRGMSEAAKAMAHACLNLSHHAAVLADENYDAVEELYQFRQQCQEERERDADGPVCGDEPKAESRDAVVRGGTQGRPVSADSGNGYRTSRAGFTYPFYCAKGTHDSGP